MKTLETLANEILHKLTFETGKSTTQIVVEGLKEAQEQVENITYEPVLSAWLCDNCQMPKMENSGDGVSEPLNPVLWCSKQKLVVEPLPEPSERVNKCEFFKPCT